MFIWISETGLVGHSGPADLGHKIVLHICCSTKDHPHILRELEIGVWIMKYTVGGTIYYMVHHTGLLPGCHCLVYGNCHSDSFNIGSHDPKQGIQLGSIC